MSNDLNLPPADQVPSQKIEEVLNNLFRGPGQELQAFLNECCFEQTVDQTAAYLHCYHVSLDGNGRPRVDDFIEFIATKLVEYSIPRKAFAEAKEYLNKHNSDSKFAELRTKAMGLFTDLANTGEGGELLLYILVQEFLKIPQLLCKMPLKTNNRMHYHGVDGIHAKYDDKNDILALYWGESKLYKTVDDAVRECFNSLKAYLLDTGGSGSPQERDINLVKDYLDLDNEQLEKALINYFDKNHPNYNKVNYRGICLIGFDSNLYPSEPNKMSMTQLHGLISARISEWLEATKNELLANAPLGTFEIHVFMVPFPSVDDFRQKFLKALKLTPAPRVSKKTTARTKKKTIVKATR